MILREMAPLLLVGLAIGAGVSLAAARGARALLFGVSRCAANDEDRT